MNTICDFCGKAMTEKELNIVIRVSIEKYMNGLPHISSEEKVIYNFFLCPNCTPDNIMERKTSVIEFIKGKQ